VVDAGRQLGIHIWKAYPEVIKYSIKTSDMVMEILE